MPGSYIHAEDQACCVYFCVFGTPYRMSGRGDRFVYVHAIKILWNLRTFKVYDERKPHEDVYNKTHTPAQLLCETADRVGTVFRLLLGIAFPTSSLWLYASPTSESSKSCL